MNLIPSLKDRYELTKSVKITDVKGYLQKEYDRASEREKLIKDLETEIRELKKTEIKYEALLVVQENTQKRIETQDKRIKELKDEIKEADKSIKLAKSREFDIKKNAELKLKERDQQIKELKKQIKKYESTKLKTSKKNDKGDK